MNGASISAGAWIHNFLSGCVVSVCPLRSGKMGINQKVKIPGRIDEGLLHLGLLLAIAVFVEKSDSE